MKQHRPVPRGCYAPLPFTAILSPEGRFYRAEPWKHGQVAYELTGEEWDELMRDGWLRLSMDVVHFAWNYKEPTQPQMDAIWDYCQFRGWEIDEVFDLHDRPKARAYFGLQEVA